MNINPNVYSKVLAAFGIIPQAIIPITSGCINELLQIHTNEAIYALKYIRNRSLEAIQREQLVMQTAQLGGIPIPDIQKTIENETIYEHEGYWSLSSWIEGSSIAAASLDEEKAKLLGEMLGRLHIVLEALSADQLPSLVQNVCVEPDKTMEDLEFVECMIRNRMDSFADYALLFSGEVKKRLLAGTKVLPFYRSAKKQVLHGDFWFQNILFHRGHIQSIIDWEFTCSGPKLWEISYVFGAYLLQPSSFEATARLASSFVRGYCSISPLLAEEARMIPELYRWFRLNELRPLQFHYFHNESRLTTFLPHILNKFTFIEQYEEELTTRLADSTVRISS
ncbi:hypothetical protein GCM10008018_61380 [Paenibacillus marchantiophytorum]|uniref:Aminoglycoside phosphotransferase domain-containing protein n=1 Tax=Paenibacillus marchantiophytorum TaxID=1619310 RepID=A0ABQ1FDW4_9BACL|nr:phosphotransferase [Paenibacillus marchantiophytorum]GGA07356.1 hypothetical protein GCM10008018_61380 [Paenibacillus marchantiophytorum]